MKGPGGWLLGLGGGWGGGGGAWREAMVVSAGTSNSMRLTECASSAKRLLAVEYCSLELFLSANSSKNSQPDGSFGSSVFVVSWGSNLNKVTPSSKNPKGL